MPRRAGPDEARRSPSLRVARHFCDLRSQRRHRARRRHVQLVERGCEVSRTSASIRPAPCRGSAEPLMSRGIRSARAAGCAYRHIERWVVEEFVRVERDSRITRWRSSRPLPQRLRACWVSRPHCCGRPPLRTRLIALTTAGPIQWPPYVEVLMATVMSGSRRLSRAAGRPAQPGRSGWCRRHGGRGSCGFQAQLSSIARHGMALSPRPVRAFANGTSRK